MRLLLSALLGAASVAIPAGWLGFAAAQDEMRGLLEHGDIFPGEALTASCVVASFTGAVGAAVGAMMGCAVGYVAGRARHRLQ